MSPVRSDANTIFDPSADQDGVKHALSFFWPVPFDGSETTLGEVVHIDRFGNLISNLTAYHVKEVRGFAKRSEPYIRIGGLTIQGLVRTYDEGVPDQPQALINSNGYVEVFLKEGRAVQRLMAARGTRVELC